MRYIYTYLTYSDIRYTIQNTIYDIQYIYMATDA